MADDLALLMTLRVQGLTTPERAAAALGVPEDEAVARLRSVGRRGIATERTGRITGFTLMAEGVALLNDLVAQEGLRGDPELLDRYDRFLQLNERVLRLSSDWQVRRARGVEVTNDHCDPDYDASVIDKLVELHDRARVCIDKVAGRVPRFAPYRDRLDRCVDRLLAGDRAAFTAAMAESYHTVWFELHQDLLLTLGIERTE